MENESRVIPRTKKSYNKRERVRGSGYVTINGKRPEGRGSSIDHFERKRWSTIVLQYKVHGTSNFLVTQYEYY